MSSGSEGQQHLGKLVSKNEGKTECVKWRPRGDEKREREARGAPDGTQGYSGKPGAVMAGVRGAWPATGCWGTGSGLGI